MLGDAWKKSGQKRQELFITTKIAVQNFGHNKAKRAFDESLQKLQTEYVDLLLLHFPVTILRKKAWLALEEIHTAGSAKSIGVSNYTIRHLEEMQSYAKIMPAVNQVELHVFLQQPELVKYYHDNGVAVEAYSPLAHGHGLDDPVIAGIAKKYGKSPAQIMLRWLVEQDFVVIPKSVTPERIRENTQVFDFELDQDDLQALKTLDRDMRTCWSPVHVP
jgi:diketogulonate reductase-like aldo/keto reductase